MIMYIMLPFSTQDLSAGLAPVSNKAFHSLLFAHFPPFFFIIFAIASCTFIAFFLCEQDQ